MCVPVFELLNGPFAPIVRTAPNLEPARGVRPIVISCATKESKIDAYSWSLPHLWICAKINPATKASPTFHMEKAATASVMKRSVLSLLKSQEPSASCPPVRNRTVPSTARGKTLKIDSIEPLHSKAKHSRRVARTVG